METKKLSVHSRKALLLAAALVLSGCTHKEDEKPVAVEPIRHPEKAATVLEQAYQKADSGAKTAVDEVTRALKQKDYEGAVVGLQVLQANPARSFEQSQVLIGMMAGLQKELAEGAERGDPKAIKAIEALKRRRGR